MISASASVGVPESSRVMMIGDLLLLHCDAGYVYSEISSSRFSAVSLFPKDQLKRGSFRDIQCALFKLVTCGTGKSGVIGEDIDEGNRSVFFGEKIQLQHQLTGKFLTVNVEKSSVTERENLMVKLGDRGENACFNVQPSNGLQSTGSQVTYEDDVLFECYSYSGRYLHCSGNHLGAVYDNFNEVNLSSSASVFALTAHCTNSSCNTSVLKAGVPMRLFYCDLECYLLAEGSIFKPPKEVNCKKCKVSKATLQSAMTTANSTWVLETTGHPLNGESISYGQRFSIKHLSSHCYLAVDENKEVCILNINDEHEDWETKTTFTLKSAVEQVQANNLILLESSFVHICHVDSGLYLHSLQSVQNEESLGARRFTELKEWISTKRSHRMFEVGTSNEQKPSQAFIICSVNDDQLKDLNYVSGYTALTKWVLSVSLQMEESVSDTDVVFVKESIEELTQYLLEMKMKETIRLKRRQKLLRNLERFPSFYVWVKEVSARLKEKILLIELIVTIVSLLAKRSRWHGVCEAYYTLLDAYLTGRSSKNKRYLAGKVLDLTPQATSPFASNVHVQKAAAVLVKLTTNCWEIIRWLKLKHMEYILTGVLSKSSKRGDLCMGLLSALCVCNGFCFPSTQSMVVERFCFFSQQEDVLYRFLMDDGSVFVSKVQGQAKHLENASTKLMNILQTQLVLIINLCKGPNKQAILKLKDYIPFDVAIHCASNTALSTKMQALFVEVLSTLYVRDSVNTTNFKRSYFDFNGLSENQSRARSASQSISWTGYTNQYVPELKAWIRNALQSPDDVLCEVLLLLSHLMKFGFYDATSDINEVMQIVMGVLYYKCQGTGEMNVKVVTSALEVVKLIVEWNIASAQEQLVLDFHKGRMVRERKRSSSAKDRSLRELLDSNDLPYSSRIVNIVQEKLKSMMKLSQLNFCLSIENNQVVTLENILLMLARCRTLDVSLPALKVLRVFCMMEEELISSVEKTTLINSDEKLTAMTIYLSSHYPRLRELLRFRVNSVTEDILVELSTILQALSNFCIYTKDERSSCYLIQKFLVDSGIYFDVMDYISQCSLSDDPFLFETSLSSCFHLLTTMCYNFTNFKKRLYTYLDDLLEVKVALPDLARLFYVLFRGHEIDLKVKDFQVKKMMQIIASPETPTEGKTEMLKAVQALIKLEDFDFFIERNQSLAMKFFTETQNLFCDYLVGHEEAKIAQRKDLLSLPVDKDGDQDLCLLLSITNFIATCASGRNKPIITISKSLYSLEELLEHLLNPSVPIKRKSVFLFFLVTVYVSSDEEIKAAFTQAESKMWELLKEIEHAIVALIDVLKRFNLQDLLFIHPALSSSHSMLYYSQSEIVAVERGSRKEIGEGLLVFAFNGVFTLLRSCYKADVFSERHQDVSFSISKALQELKEYLPDYCTGIHQLKMFYLTLVHATTTGSEGDNRAVLLKSLSTRSEHVAAFRESPDDDLNNSFQSYVARCKSAYEDDSSCAANACTQYTHTSPGMKKLVHTFSSAQRNGGDSLLTIVNYLKSSFRVAFFDAFKASGSILKHEQWMSLDATCFEVLKLLISSANSSEQFHGFMVECDAFETALKFLAHPSKRIEFSALVFINTMLTMKTKKLKERIESLLAGDQELEVFTHTVRRNFDEASRTYKVSYKLLGVVESRQLPCNTPLNIEQLQSNQEKEQEVIPMESDFPSTLESGESMLENETIGVFLKLQGKQKIKVALSIIALLCEEQNPHIQDYMRDIAMSIRKDNVVGAVCNFLKHFYTIENERACFHFSHYSKFIFAAINDISSERLKKWRLDQISLISTILHALTKLCVGNQENQEVLLQQEFVKAVNGILSFSLQSEDHLFEAIKLKVEALELVRIVMEETHPRTKDIVVSLLKSLDIKAIVDIVEVLQTEKKQRAGLSYRLKSLLGRNSQESALVKQWEEKCLEKAYLVLHLCEDSTLPCGKKSSWSVTTKSKASESIPNSVIDTYESDFQSIEVLYRGRNEGHVLAKVEFPFDSKDKLREEVIEDVKWKINRDSEYGKSKDLISWMKVIRDEINHQHRLRSRRVLNFLTSHMQLLSLLLLIVTVVLNGMIVATFSFQNESQDNVTNSSMDYTILTPTWFTHYVIYFLGVAHLILAIWLLLSFIVIQWPHFINPLMTSWWIVKWIKKWDFNYTPRDLSSRPSKRLDEHWINWNTVHLSVVVITSFLSLVFAASGLFYGYLYSYSLFHIIFMSRRLQNVLFAVVRSWYALLLLSILGIWVIYIYAVLAINFFPESFAEGASDRLSLHCRNLGECFITITRYSFFQRIVDVPVIPNTTSELFIRALFDVSFYVIWSIIGLNIVLGSIVNNFIELRAKNRNNSKDSKNFCFICHIPRHEFERRGKNFRHKHIVYDHNKWNYVYYYYYLSSVPPANFSAIEKYVWEQICSDKIDFFPLYRARSLPDYKPPPDAVWLMEVDGN